MCFVLSTWYTVTIQKNVVSPPPFFSLITALLFCALIPWDDVYCMITTCTACLPVWPVCPVCSRMVLLVVVVFSCLSRIVCQGFRYGLHEYPLPPPLPPVPPFYLASWARHIKRTKSERYNFFGGPAATHVIRQRYKKKHMHASIYDQRTVNKNTHIFNGHNSQFYWLGLSVAKNLVWFDETQGPIALKNNKKCVRRGYQAPFPLLVVVVDSSASTRATYDRGVALFGWSVFRMTRLA